MGNSCSRRKMTTLYGELADSNTNKINELICEEIKQQWQLALIVDDYTSIQRKRRPKTVKAISKCVLTTHHSIDGFEIIFCVQTVSCHSSMYKLGFSYSSIMPGWVRDTFFNPKLKRHRHSSAQFYSKQIVYETLQKYCCTINIHLIIPDQPHRLIMHMQCPLLLHTLRSHKLV